MNTHQRARAREQARAIAERARAFREEARYVGISPVEQQVEALQLTIGHLADAVALLADVSEAQECA